MTQERLPVRKIREVLRLQAEGFSKHQIAGATGSARSTVQGCLRRCAAAGLTWPLPPELDEAALYGRLYRREVPLSRTPAPDFVPSLDDVFRTLRNRRPTLLLSPQ